MTSDRRFRLGTSWKMTKTLAEAMVYADELRAATLPAEPQIFVLPAHTALAAVRDRLASDGRFLLGAQNAHPGADGSVTGEVSMEMVRDAGATLLEIGHADRRTMFGETDDLVAAKVAAAVGAGLVPLVCVGETGEQRARGEAVRAVTAQVRAALGGSAGTAPREILVAYEPQWAIGSRGRPPVAGELSEVLAAIRRELDSCLAAEVRAELLYGGSVSADNVHELVTGLDVDGLFVARAAWSAAGLIDLAHRCAEALAERAAPTLPDRLPDPLPAVARKEL